MHWHLTSEETVGQGAGARFRIHRKLDRYSWADLTFADVQSRGRILARGRIGKFNRSRWIVVVEVDDDAGGSRVRLSVETAPKLPTDRLMEAATFTKHYHRRRWGKAMRRLRSILEDGEDRGTPASISGGARKPATGIAAPRRLNRPPASISGSSASILSFALRTNVRTFQINSYEA